MKLVCNFVGGRLAGAQIPVEEAEIMTAKRSRDWSEERTQGDLVPRAELDNKPVFGGYLGPMWDGLRYEIDGRTYYDFDLKHHPELQALAEAKNIKPYGVLRYETQEVYDLLSR